MRWPAFILAVALVAASAGCGGDLAARIPGLHEIKQASGVEPTDEEQIAMLLDDVQRGMQSRQIYKVLAHVSRNYRDEEGRTYSGIETYLNTVFKDYKEIRVTRVVPRIVVQGDRARAVETFGTVAEPQDPQGEPPIHLQGQVTVNLEKTGGRWLIVEWGSIL